MTRTAVAFPPLFPKTAFAARRLPEGFPLIPADAGLAPKAGDLALARVMDGSTGSLELRDGRIAKLFPGDAVLVVLGGQQGPQCHSGHTPETLGECALLNTSGIAGVLDRAAGGTPCKLRLESLLRGFHGRVLNINQWAVRGAPGRPAQVVAVVGAARLSHAGAVAEQLVHGLAKQARRVGVAKPTGVSLGAEWWNFLDAGAAVALDAVDAGLPSTTGADESTVTEVFQRQLGGLNRAGVDAAVVRLAGSLPQREVAALLASPQFSASVDGIVLAAADGLSAVEAARRLRAMGLNVVAVSGAISRSPLACREARAALGLPILAPEQLADASVLNRLLDGVLVSDRDPGDEAPTVSLPLPTPQSSGPVEPELVLALAA
jgi:hypothetical protein